MFFVCLSSFYLLIGKHCYLFYYTPIILKSLSNFVNKLIFLTKYCTFLFCARRVGGMAGERFYSRECDRDDVVVYRFMPEVGQA